MPHTLINHYTAIELSSTQMLAFATVSDWGAVVDCEQVCSMQIQQLRQQLGAATHQHGMTAEQKAQKRQIMGRILAIDAQIRTLAEPATGCDALQYRQRATAKPHSHA